MSLSIGIIGLPNVGKSTVFNALTGSQNAQVANYPFCTIKPNRAIVPIYDHRLQKLQSIVRVPNIVYATIEFVDIAGLVKGASKGEGLGNQFLSEVRNTDALIHVVRGFEDPNVSHLYGELNPRSDIEIINYELALSDLAQLERKINKLESDVKGDKETKPKLNLAKSILEHLSHGNPARTHNSWNSDLFNDLMIELRFLTAKPIIYLVNVDETGLVDDTKVIKTVREIAQSSGSKILVICARLEEELHDMSPKDQMELLSLAGVKSSGLDQVAKKGRDALNLISFFTKNKNEVRAWNISRGTNARKAAGVIHTDFERGFIRAEVVPYDIFIEYGSYTAVRSHGLMRSEGKDYIVQDGDIILFRFNV